VATPLESTIIDSSTSPNSTISFADTTQPSDLSAVISATIPETATISADASQTNTHMTTSIPELATAAAVTSTTDSATSSLIPDTTGHLTTDYNLQLNITPTITLQSEPTVLNFTDTSGHTNTAIPINISTGLGDFLYSDHLSNITISGTPTDAILSSGIHNSDGSWTLTSTELTGLTMTTHSTGNFDIGITANTLGINDQNIQLTGNLQITVDNELLTQAIPTDNVQLTTDTQLSTTITTQPATVEDLLHTLTASSAETSNNINLSTDTSTHNTANTTTAQESTDTTQTPATPDHVQAATTTNDLTLLNSTHDTDSTQSTTPTSSEPQGNWVTTVDNATTTTSTPTTTPPATPDAAVPSTSSDHSGTSTPSNLPPTTDDPFKI